MGDLDYKLRKAAEMGDAAELKVLLLQAKCNPRSKGYDGMTALMHAAYSGDASCTQLLIPLSNGLEKDSTGMTALMWAAAYGHDACTQVLVPASNVLNQNSVGMTALMHASLGGHISCVQLLLPLGDVSAVDYYGLTACDHALKGGHGEVSSQINAYVLAMNEAATLSADSQHHVKIKSAPRRV